ncbi:hypothetical protein HK100_007656, partial [Physocladia obscura]
MQQPTKPTELAAHEATSLLPTVRKVKSQRKYEPHNGRGRKKLAELSPTARAQQMRDAQRALRARKFEYVTNLELKVSRLTEQVSVLQQQLLHYKAFAPREHLFSVTNLTPDSDNSNVSEVNDQIESGSSIDINPISIESVQSDTVMRGISNSTDFLKTVWVSAEQLYGPVEIEPFKERMNALESLKDSNVVNRSFDLFVALSRATETGVARTLQLKKIREHAKLMNKCGVLDSMKLAEIESEFEEKYFRYNARFREICANPNYDPMVDPIVGESKITRQVSNFRESLRKIPSLKKSFDKIDHFCYFWAIKLDGKFSTDDMFYMANL